MALSGRYRVISSHSQTHSGLGWRAEQGKVRCSQLWVGSSQVRVNTAHRLAVGGTETRRGGGDGRGRVQPCTPRN